MPDTVTLLDAAHEAMSSAPEDDALRLAFYARLADAELSLLLVEDAEGETITPQIFPFEDGPVALAFDLPERLTAFTEGPAPYASAAGRVLIRMLAEEGIALGLNLDVAPSSILLPADAVQWLAGRLDQRPKELDALPQDIAPPGDLPQTLLAELHAKLALAAGLAPCAYLSSVRYGAGWTHLLAFLDAVPGAETVLARSVAQALSFSGLDAAEIDVAFLRESDPAVSALKRHGLRIDLPAPPDVAPEPTAPGTDPAKPPRLR